MLTLFRWSAADKKAHRYDTPEIRATLAELKASPDLMWFDLDRPDADEERLVFDEFFTIHSLSREDVTRERRDPQASPHLPKVEEFPDYLFVIVNPLHPKFCERLAAPAGAVAQRCHAATQLSAVLTEKRLLTHHVEDVTSVNKLRNYLERHPEQAARGPDYLYHLILDDMVDEYAPVLDQVGDALDDLESTVFIRTARGLAPRLLHLKRDVIVLRKTLVYEREVLSRLCRGEFALIDQREAVYYRNVYDHLVRFTELIESSREMVSDLMQSHLAATSNRLNEIMKVLTMISTSLLPMTVVAGVYGMNFTNMPEIDWNYGYPFALALMILAGVAPLFFFKWRKWF